MQVSNHAFDRYRSCDGRKESRTLEHSCSTAKNPVFFDASVRVRSVDGDTPIPCPIFRNAVNQYLTAQKARLCEEGVLGDAVLGGGRNCTKLKEEKYNNSSFFLRVNRVGILKKSTSGQSPIRCEIEANYWTGEYFIFKYSFSFFFFRRIELFFLISFIFEKFLKTSSSGIEFIQEPPFPFSF